MRKPISPCKGCQDRTPTCHGIECNHGWNDFVAAQEAYRNSIYQVRNQDAEWMTFHRIQVVRTKGN